MRCTQVSLTTEPVIYAYKSNGNKIFQVKNRSAADIIYIQFGANGGKSPDAWPLSAGETFTLDPAAPADNIWLWSSVAGTANTVMLG